ncbi:MAG: hypothetical protein Fur0044_11540 [Anaerolineae bacterium]
MSERFFGRTGGNHNEAWEARLRDAARAFPYPPTPPIAGAVRAQLAQEAGQKAGLPVSRRLVWAALIVLLILGGLLAVPQVRAKVVEFLQIGAIRIFLVEPTPTSTPLPSTATAQPTPTPIASVLDLAGETTLAEASQQVDFPIRLPTYPADLGQPDAVFVQELGGPVVVLVWLDEADPSRVRLSLHQLGPGTFGEKGDPGRVEETTVNGRRAIWAKGPYILQFRHGSRVDYDLRRLVEGRVLIWTEGGITYRLETDLSLAEAVQIAESLR